MRHLRINLNREWKDSISFHSSPPHPVAKEAEQEVRVWVIYFGDYNHECLRTNRLSQERLLAGSS